MTYHSKKTDGHESKRASENLAFFITFKNRHMAYYSYINRGDKIVVKVNGKTVAIITDGVVKKYNQKHFKGNREAMCGAEMGIRRKQI